MNESLYDIKLIEKSDDNDWKSLLAKSRQYTPFMRDEYLASIGYCSQKYLVYRKNIPCCGICLPISMETGKTEAYVPYAPYQGLIYSSTEDCYRDYHNNLEATELLLNYIFAESGLKEVSFSNSYDVRDIRGIQWHHYHEPEKGMYQIDVNYTSVIEIGEYDELSNISKGRKLDYKYSRERYGLDICKSEALSEFLLLYEKTFAEQGIKIEVCTLDVVAEVITTCIKQKIGELWYAIDSNGKSVDAIFVVTDCNRSYYLFSANDPDARKMGGGTLLLIEKIRELKERGISTFDFVGVNSPYRGDFKLSFGAIIKPYYTCRVDYRNREGILM